MNDGGPKPDPNSNADTARYHRWIDLMGLLYVVWCGGWYFVGEYLDQIREGLGHGSLTMAILSGLMIIAALALLNLQAFSEHSSFERWNLNWGPPSTHRGKILAWAWIVLIVGSIVWGIAIAKYVHGDRESKHPAETSDLRLACKTWYD